MRLFEIATPDGRRVRHSAADPVAAASKLLPGYTVAGEVIGADANGAGGFVIPAGQGESPLAVLLRLYGADMHDWLRTQGFVKPDP
jgi:hypothetical protein